MLLFGSKIRDGNSLIVFLSESLVFFAKNEQMSDLIKTMRDLLIRSFLVSDLSDLLPLAYLSHLW